MSPSTASLCIIASGLFKYKGKNDLLFVYKINIIIFVVTAKSSILFHLRHFEGLIAPAAFHCIVPFDILQPFGEFEDMTVEEVSERIGGWV